jgi:hypothetical protein
VFTARLFASLTCTAISALALAQLTPSAASADDIVAAALGNLRKSPGSRSHHVYIERGWSAVYGPFGQKRLNHTYRVDVVLDGDYIHRKVVEVEGKPISQCPSPMLPSGPESTHQFRPETPADLLGPDTVLNTHTPKLVSRDVIRGRNVYRIEFNERVNDKLTPSQQNWRVTMWIDIQDMALIRHVQVKVKDTGDVPVGTQYEIDYAKVDDNWLPTRQVWTRKRGLSRVETGVTYGEYKRFRVNTRISP